MGPLPLGGRGVECLVELHPLLEQPAEAVGVERASEQESLSEVALQLEQAVELLGALDALGDRA